VYSLVLLLLVNNHLIMSKIDVVDEAIIDAPPIKVMKAMDDETAGITNWWPNMEFKLRAGSPAAGENKIFDMTIKGPVNFRATQKITKIVEGKSINIDYIDGNFRGIAEWTVEPIDGGKTRLRCRVNVQTKGIASWMPASMLRNGHSKTMQDGFKSLNQFLKNKN